MAKKKRGLGVGALLSGINANIEQDEQQKKEVVSQLVSQFAHIPITQIERNPYQPRETFEETALAELAASIQSLGLIQPITVRRLAPDQYQLISGERRFRASQQAGCTEIPAYVRIANDQAMIEMALVENIQRHDLNAIEVALSYQRLLEEIGLTHREIAARVGKSRSHITNHLRLLKLPDVVQKSVRDGELSMGHARALTALQDDPTLLRGIYEKVIHQGLSVRQTEVLIRSLQTPATQASKEELPQAVRREQDRLAAFFDAKVSLKVNKSGRGQITIPFANEDDLQRILDLIEQDED